MRRWIIAGMLVLLVACGGAADPAKAIVGEWKGEINTLKFTSLGYMLLDDFPESYTITPTEIVVGGVGGAAIPYTLDGDTLTLKPADGSPLILKRVSSDPNLTTIEQSVIRDKQTADKLREVEDGLK